MKNSFLTRKEEIILSTIDLIHEMGITNVSVKEIAKREQVTEASLYKHFKSKDDILSSVLDYYMKYDNDIYLTVEGGERGAVSKILTFFNLYAEYFENYRAISSLLPAFEVLLYEEKHSRKVVELLEKKNEFLIRLIREGRRRNELKKGTSARNMADILIGAFKQVVHRWRIHNFSYSLKERMAEVINEILKLYDNNNELEA